MKLRIFALVCVLAVLMAGCLRTSAACPDTSQPVCGNDGITYKNPCLAEKAGTTVKKNGTCEQAASLCSDTDGGKDIFTAGTVTDRGARLGDSCVNDATVEERFCESNTAKTESLPCPAGYACSSGKCAVVPCTDTDGGAKEETYGTASAGGQSRNDTCADGTTVREAYCEGGQALTRDIACGSNEECRDGVCAEIICSDTDGGKDTSKAGKVTHGTESGSDSCSGTSVKEYFCESGQMKSEVLSCDSGYICVSGKCEKEVCTDSDGGKKPLEKGTTSYGNKSYTDSCYSDISVIEYYCASDTSTALEKMACGEGKECYDGKCREAQCQKDVQATENTDVRYTLTSFGSSTEITMYTGSAIELNNKYMVKVYSVTGNKTTLKLYDTYAKMVDGTARCSVTIYEGDEEADLCGEDTGTVAVSTVNDADDYAVLSFTKAYVSEYYDLEKTVTDWTDLSVCPDDTEVYDSFEASFFPYLDTESSGLDLAGKSIKVFGLSAEIVEITSDTITVDMDGDEYELQDGETFEYEDQEYEVSLDFNDAGLTKMTLSPS